MSLLTSPTEEISHAGGIVYRKEVDTRYLIIAAKQNPEHWVFPKGHLESGETPEDAALREVREEAGVVARIVQRAGESRFDLDGEAVHVVYYVMEYLRETESKEHRQICWCNYERAIDLLSFEDSRALLPVANAVIQAAIDKPD